MVPLINALLITVAAAICIPILVLCVEVAAAVLPRRPHRRGGPEPELAEGVRTVVLIPAHNEEAVIGRTLASLMPTIGPDDRVLVVADNCTDDTAAVARAVGADVVERQDGSRRGKGFALQFGLAALQSDPPDVVAVVDADCEVHPQLVAALSRTVADTGEPAQALYEFHAAPGSRSRAVGAISQLGLRFRGLVRLSGAARLGTPCPMLGSGMAFPWSALRDVPMIGGDLVEDMRLGIDLMIAGYSARFRPDVFVSSQLPEAPGAFVSQRTRWEHGHLTTLLVQGPRLFKAAVLQRRPTLVWAALSLAVPPLALLTLLWALAVVLAAAGWLAGTGAAPLWVLAGAGALLITVVLAGWVAFCRRVIPLRALAGIPVYVAKKLPIYMRFLTRRQSAWVRTPRAEAHKTGAVREAR